MDDKKQSSLISQLVFINLVVFILALPGTPMHAMASLFMSFDPNNLTDFWRPFTYSFVHADFWHLFINMVVIYTFGSELESMTSRRKLFLLYMFAGIFSAYFWVMFSISPGERGMIGASGAICGVMGALATISEKSKCMLLFIPLQTRTLVIVYGAYNLMCYTTSFGSNVAYLAHFGGLIGGFIFAKVFMGRETREHTAPKVV
jgi:membrane associated rhomboid family serine protease